MAILHVLSLYVFQTSDIPRNGLHIFIEYGDAMLVYFRGAPT